MPLELVKNSQLAAFLVKKEIQAPKLKQLNLSKSNLSVLPSSAAYWQSFERLSTLDLRYNNLATVPVGLLHAPKLNKVLLSNNPLQDIPSSSKKANWQWKDIQVYLQTLDAHSTRWQEQKLLVIGEPGSGK